MKKTILLLATLLLASMVVFAQQSPTGQGPSDLNGGLINNWNNLAPQMPAQNNNGGPGLGRHNLLDATTNTPLGCESCHLPHTAPVYGASFLWAWKTLPSLVMTYETDTNPSGMLVTPPTGMAASGTRSGNVRSMLCLSCHDGTSASANGIIGSVTSTGSPYPLLNTSGGVGDLGGEHPVDALVPPNSDYQQPVPAQTTLSATPDSVSAYIGVDKLPLWDNAYNVECSSCHDQHNDYQTNQGAAGGFPFLRVANTDGTYLCRECHNK